MVTKGHVVTYARGLGAGLAQIAAMLSECVAKARSLKSHCY